MPRKNSYQATHLHIYVHMNNFLESIYAKSIIATKLVIVEIYRIENQRLKSF